MSPDAWPEFFFSIALRSLILAGAGVALCLAVRHCSNRCRFIAAAAGIAALAFLPVMLAVTPQFEFEFTAGGRPGGSAMADSLLPGILLAAWLLGSGWFLIRLACSALAVLRLRRDSTAAPGSALRAVERLRPLLSVKGRPHLAISPRISRPVVCGLFRPSILLPPRATGWSEDRLESVLAHEMAHIARRDLWTQWLCQVVCAIYWFNPFAWRLAAWQVREREIAADEQALAATGGNPTGYARELLAIATEPATPNEFAHLPCAAAMLGATSKLEDRINCLFAATSRKPRMNRLVPGLACLAALLVFVACTAFDPVASCSAGPWTHEEIRLRLTAEPFPGG